MVQGRCHPQFSQVMREFERNFVERQELGASVCITYDGETVVDLWGGSADISEQRAWQSNTVTSVWSCTKAATALCVHMLAASGNLDLHAPVAQYWPEFAEGGKECITVAMLLSHQAGLAALIEPVEGHIYCDWHRLVQRLASQKPLWEPGTRHGYHALTFGHLLGEVVRRVSGQSIGCFFKEKVADPLGLDFWIGLPESERSRVAPVIAPNPADYLQSGGMFFRMALEQPGSIANLIIANSGAIMSDGAINHWDYQRAEIPAANGITNARGLAGLYRPLSLDGAYGGYRLLSEDFLPLLSRVYTAGYDLTLGIYSRFSLGFIKTGDRLQNSHDDLLLSEEAFGHTGSGGSIGFADPRAKLSFGYTMNRMGAGIGLNRRGQSLVDAAYRSIGYRQSKADGTWMASK